MYFESEMVEMNENITKCSVEGERETMTSLRTLERPLRTHQLPLVGYRGPGRLPKMLVGSSWEMTLLVPMYPP